MQALLTMMDRALLLALSLALGACVSPIPPDPALFDTAPVARIEASPAGSLGTPLVLDGSRSYDPDEDELDYHWSIHEAPAGSDLAANPFSANGSRNAAVTTFAPDALGRYTVRLQVTDRTLWSESAFAVVNVGPADQLPEADAGSDLVAVEGIEVCADGTGSRDPLGGDLTYSWTVSTRPDGSSLTGADLTGGDTDTACFLPDAPGLFTLGLTVAAGPRVSAPDYVDVSAQTTNQVPVADGAALGAWSCSYLSFDGTASTDPDGDALSYRWALLLGPEGSATPLGPEAFDDATLAMPTLYADVAGTWYVELQVFDGEDWSAPQLLEVETTPKPVNTPPQVAHQGDVYVADLPQPCNSICPAAVISLDAGATFDPDDDPVVLSWEVVTGNASLDVTEGPTPKLTVASLPGSCAFGSPTSEQVVVRVTATDCSGDTDASELVVLYECGVGL